MAWRVGQRAEVSITANIAEGYGRLHCGDYVHHLSIARGSLAELETPITIAVRPDFIQSDDAMLLWNIGEDVGQLLIKRIQSLKGQEKKTYKLFQLPCQLKNFVGLNAC